MTPRDRYRRCQAFARAAHRALSFFRHRMKQSLANPHRETDKLVQDLLTKREAHAWARLPDTARAAILTPSP